ncbi:MAG: N-acetyltransferase [Rubrivivax sp.]|nr:MAG: N-acetyltransferase [Rubrivivax sp.]
MSEPSPSSPSPTPAWLAKAHASPASIDTSVWNALLDASAQPTPFMKHEWLSALHETGCAVSETGWAPLFLTVHASEGGPVEAACALYVKSHSYGEYVFDWAWADAHQRAGLPYYPKLLCASPFTPVPGSRLLARTPAARQALLSAIEQWAVQIDASSAHVLLPDDADREAAQGAGWLMRQGVQFHWTNRQVMSPGSPPYADFADFLASLHRDKRKKIQQERRRVVEVGVSVQVRRGAQITQADWDFFYACYSNTYLARGNPPYLNRAFFEQVGRTMHEHWLLFIAEVQGQRVAASLIGIDAARGVAFGRYWGAVTHIPNLHFELCYYAPLAWCIEQGFGRFEGGAQGEHKMARGLMPVSTWSAHWLKDARFADAVARYLEREREGVDGYVDELLDRQPFKATTD